MMHITHAHSDISASRGGIVAALAALLPALRAGGINVDLVALEDKMQARGDSPLESPFLHLAAPRDPLGFGYAPELKPLLREVARESSLIHSHGLWVYMSYAAYRVAREKKIPHIIAVHGMMEPYIQGRSRWKKAPIEVLFQNRALQCAAAIQALSLQEVEDVRRLGFKTPVAVVPNGVHLESIAHLPPRAAFEARFPVLRDKKILLFMARLHPKKGLTAFLPAWKKVVAQHPEWHLVLAGPDEGGHRAELEAQVESLGLAKSVLFAGLLTGESKREALGAASAFVLPSLSEGFSMGVLEALGVGLPTLFTPGCNFPEASKAGAAICVSSDEKGAVAGLEQLFALSDDEMAQMGFKGQALVKEKYTWEAVAASLKSVYHWCAGSGPKPACVFE